MLTLQCKESAVKSDHGNAVFDWFYGLLFLVSCITLLLSYGLAQLENSVWDILSTVLWYRSGMSYHIYTLTFLLMGVSCFFSQFFWLNFISVFFCSNVFFQITFKLYVAFCAAFIDLNFIPKPNYAASCILTVILIHFVHRKIHKSEYVYIVLGTYSAVLAFLFPHVTHLLFSLQA